MRPFRLSGFFDWSASVGRLFGIPIRLHITILFFLLPALRGDGMDLGHKIEYAVAIVLSILVHELGHALTAKRFGLTGLSITLHGFGGFAVSHGVRSPRQSLLISLAGPAATFALGLLCLGVSALGMRSPGLGIETLIQIILIHAVGRINILLGFLNLIPVPPWDGGQALQAILAHRMPEIKAMRAAAHFGLILAPALLIYGWATDANFFGLFAIVGILTCYTTLAGSGGIRFGEVFADRRSRKEVEAVKRREEARTQAYLDDVKAREKERADGERLRRLLDSDD